jgi:hypothetical protein
MKKVLLSLLLSGSMSFVFAQGIPCPEGLGAGTNMGAGDCKDCVGANDPTFDFSQKATAKIVLEFTETLPCIPRLLSITNDVGVTLPAVCGVGQIKQGGGNNSTLVEYCFWGGDDDFFKARAFLSATIKYDCNAITTICPLDGTEEIPLPVHFKSFNANRQSSNVAIIWTTASEQNNKGFNVQRNDGGQWQTVAFVPSQALEGNSVSDINYAYTDINNEKGISQYRIQQVDLDGKFAYTDIRAIRGDGVSGKVVIYPNPTNDGKINIVFDDTKGFSDVQVSDMQGRIIRSFKGVTNNMLMIERLTSGFYTIRITNPVNAASSVHKVVVK